MYVVDAIANLNKLLCCNVEVETENKLKHLVRKRYLLWHPDKNKLNPDKYKELFLELQESWKCYQKFLKRPQMDTSDLFCDEEMFSSEDEDYNNSPFDDTFFHCSPEKNITIPDEHKPFFRSKSNRRAGKLFAIYLISKDEEKFEMIYKRYQCLIDYFGIFRYVPNACVLLINFLSECRITDIRKELRKIKLTTFDIYYCVKFNLFLNELIKLYNEPIYEPCTQKKTEMPSEEEKKHFSYKLLAEFATEHNITDVYTLMYKYAHFAKPCNYEPKLISNDHQEDHSTHVDNAKLFVCMADRKKAAKSACDIVLAEHYIRIKTETPAEFLNLKCKEIGDRLIEEPDCEIFGLADFYQAFHVKKFKNIAHCIINSFIYGEPRNRYTILKGSYKSGKTSLAYAFLKLFEGISININGDKSRLPFYLGNAIGRRFILFDDVKGKNYFDTSLSFGHGFQNLDDLRDYLDGHVEVQLEKKNQQPIMQVFPPGIITCNNYVIEPAILERVYGPIKMRASKYWDCHPIDKVSVDLIFIACVLNNLLPVESYVHEHFYRKKEAWWKQHDINCNCIRVSYFYYYI